MVCQEIFNSDATTYIVLYKPDSLAKKNLETRENDLKGLLLGLDNLRTFHRKL